MNLGWCTFSRAGRTYGSPLDPAVAQIIPLLPLRDPNTMTPQSARDALRALAAARADIPPPPVKSIDETEVMGAEARLPARVYRGSREKSPTVIFFHCGGWVAGDLETHNRQARLLAIETGAVVISVDYRRPPETRFPGAFDDGLASVRDVFARIDEFGGDNKRVGIAGDSAGGNLAEGKGPLMFAEIAMRKAVNAGEPAPEAGLNRMSSPILGSLSKGDCRLLALMNVDVQLRQYRRHRDRQDYPCHHE